jgi:hypothetical protein
MRRLVTYLLTSLFIAGFCGFFAIQSLVTYARDTNAVVATARDAGLRQSSVDLATELIYEELRGTPQLASVPRPQVAVAVGTVITERWVEGVVRDAHTGLVAALDGAGDTAEIDLEPTKDGLFAAFTQLGARIQAECVAILGPEPCVSNGKSRAAMAAYLLGVRSAIQRIPERVDLLAPLEASGQAERVEALIDIDTLRRRLTDLGALRWLGLAALGVGLVLIALVNWRPAGRTLQATGAALAAAAVTYLVLAKIVGWLAPRLIAGAGERVRAQHADLGASATIVMDGLERMLAELLVRSLGMAREVVIACAIAGVLLLVASRFFPRGD